MIVIVIVIVIVFVIVIRCDIAAMRDLLLFLTEHDIAAAQS